MKRLLILSVAAIAAVLVILAFVLGRRTQVRVVDPNPPTSPTIDRPAAESGDAGLRSGGFLYGRITRQTGSTYEGRLRFGGDEEAFWSDYFNGFKSENPWASYVPAERLKERRPIEIFGIEIARREREIDLGRPVMARFGDIDRIDAQGRDVLVALKSGTVFDLDRLEASDFDDGLRVWDAEHGVVDLDSLEIRTIELLPAAPIGPDSKDPGSKDPGSEDPVPGRLHGTVRTAGAEFTGFVQWGREEGVATDELDGRDGESEISLRFDTIRSIARESADSSRVTRLDGSELVLSGTREVGEGHRGVYVADGRYGRVLVSWDAFQRIDFTDGVVGTGPAYGDYPPGHPLAGLVTTRDGRRLDGRLVFDLDESETTETLDAPSRGVDYTIPFGLVASIVIEHAEETARVTLANGETMELERRGDLGEGNAGVLIFAKGREPPEYVPWSNVARIDF